MHLMYSTHFLPAGFQQAITLSLVFATFISATTLPLHPELDPVIHQRGVDQRLPARWKNRGCYTDEPYMRTLTSSTYSDNDMTPLICINWCITFGNHTYAGVENGRECYCGNTLTISSSSAPAGECTSPCASDPQQNCGGPDRLKLYWNGHKPQPAPQMVVRPSHWYLMGCYDDTNDARTLSTPVTLEDGPYGTDAETCIQACIKKGYSYAGMELAIECWCDNRINQGREPAVVPIYCTLACPANSLQICGGQNAIVIYSASQPPPN